MNYADEFSKILKILQNSFSVEDGSFRKQKVYETLEKHCTSEFKKRISEEFLGSGPLYSLIEDPDITEIVLDGRENIFYEKKGSGFTKHNDCFLSKWTFENFVRELTKSPLSIQNPFADGKWKNFRVHIISSPITSRSYHITLRKHPKEAWTFDKLKDSFWGPSPAIDILKKAIQSKLNILIAGPTSSGKTSVLNACLKEFHPKERAVIIEDSEELILPTPFSVKLLTRNSPQLPSIDQSILVQQSLRMRPDRIVMGEVRGSEAKDLIMALATGHEGSIGTIHAHHHKQALLRLELLVQTSRLNWSKESIRNMIHLGLDIVVILKKDKCLRKLKGIYQITGLEKTGFLFETLFQSHKFKQKRFTESIYSPSL